MSLLKSRLLFSLSRNFSTTCMSSAGHWNKDWQPAVYPKTETEMVASAKKYGLLRKEYRPLPDDGEGLGDYPDIEPVSSEGRDPFYPWDNPEYRRNIGEVMHHRFNIYTEDRINLSRKHRYPVYTVQLPLLFASLLVYYLLCIVYIELPATDLDMPAEGVKHYYFEKP